MEIYSLQGLWAPHQTMRGPAAQPRGLSQGPYLIHRAERAGAQHFDLFEFSFLQDPQESLVGSFSTGCKRLHKLEGDKNTETRVPSALTMLESSARRGPAGGPAATACAWVPGHGTCQLIWKDKCTPSLQSLTEVGRNTGSDTGVL